MTEYLLAIDQGTSSCRAIVFDRSGRIEALYQKELPLIYPQTGWVEQRPADILEGTLWALRQCVAHCKEKGVRIAGAGITNQRETTILWDKRTGEPVYNAIVWQDRRTAEYCSTLDRLPISKTIQEKTGLIVDSYFSATKIRWILDNVPEARKLEEGGNLLFGTVDSFLLWHLTDDKIHATDLANASRTMLCNLAKKKYDNDLLLSFSINNRILPKIKQNIANYGYLNIQLFGYKIPILGMAGDQQSAMIGQGCIKMGMIKATYGTGCFVLMNVGEQVCVSRNRLLATLGYCVDNSVNYALEGSIFNAGSAIQFLRDNLGLIAASSETQNLAKSVSDNGGVYFVPALTGLGAPYWRSDARGIICGLGRDVGKAHIARAALEAQAYQTRDLLMAMEDDSGVPITAIRADGGLVANEFMCQFLADISGRPIEIPAVTEATAWGAAVLAGVGAGVFSSLEDASSQWKAARIYQPQMSVDQADGLYEGWKTAVKRALL